jgi:hypothetical protein
MPTSNQEPRRSFRGGKAGAVCELGSVEANTLLALVLDLVEVGHIVGRDAEVGRLAEENNDDEVGGVLVRNWSFVSHEGALLRLECFVVLVFTQ